MSPVGEILRRISERLKNSRRDASFKNPHGYRPTRATLAAVGPDLKVFPLLHPRYNSIQFRKDFFAVGARRGGRSKLHSIEARARKSQGRPKAAGDVAKGCVGDFDDKTPGTCLWIVAQCRPCVLNTKLAPDIAACQSLRDLRG